MMDAVAVGEIFSSPSAQAFYDAFMSVDSGKGVACLFGNYAGDNMNVKMAIRKAKKQGVTVKYVVATDDVASSPKETKEKRHGIAGGVFMWKIGGAKAALGGTLDEVIDVMKQGDTKNIVRLHTGDPCVYGAIREQMDRLDKLGIEYDVCPGVSSFCGAAAALKAEYTLPDVSQTVIITRMEGRTPVPPKEKIHLLASHNATMVIFLSTGLLKELSAELVKGGYGENTPAAIVYKATWKDEKVMRCTVGTLNKTAEKNGIKKTALITVGDFLGDDYSLSKLYDKTFTTEFRKGVTE